MLVQHERRTAVSALRTIAAGPWILVPAMFVLTAVLTFTGFYVHATAFANPGRRAPRSHAAPATDLSTQVNSVPIAPAGIPERPRPSSTPAATPQRSVQVREQHASITSKKFIAPRLNANRNQPSTVIETASLPKIAVDPVPTSASLPLSPVAAAPRFIASQLPPIPPAPPQSLGSSSPKNPDAKTSGYVPPRALKQVMPTPRVFGYSVVRTPVEVQVRVRIDARGRVLDALVVRSDTAPRAPLVAGQAIAAARQWLFEPAKMHGESVPSDYTIRFLFRPESQ